MSENPYSTPKSEVATENTFEVPKNILNKIKRAWIAGIISIGITLAFTITSLLGNDILGLGLDETALVDVGLMLIFTYGVYRKSRTSAVLLLLFFTLNKAIMWFEAGAPNGLVGTLIFFWFYTQGVIGTFQYHRLAKLNS